MPGKLNRRVAIPDCWASWEEEEAGKRNVRKGRQLEQKMS